MHGSKVALAVLCLCSPGMAPGQTAENQAGLKAEESLIPIRPGVPGKVPFWDEQSIQFIGAPAFDFHPVTGAVAYRFSVSSKSGTTHTFEGREPWTSLTPIWDAVPVGMASLKVEALDKQREVIAIAGTRQ
jgi:hypothetical protein